MNLLRKLSELFGKPAPPPIRISYVGLQRYLQFYNTDYFDHLQNPGLAQDPVYRTGQILESMDAREALYFRSNLTTFDEAGIFTNAEGGTIYYGTFSSKQTTSDRFFFLTILEEEPDTQTQTQNIKPHYLFLGKFTDHPEGLAVSPLVIADRSEINNDGVTLFSRKDHTHPHAVSAHLFFADGPLRFVLCGESVPCSDLALNMASSSSIAHVQKFEYLSSHQTPDSFRMALAQLQNIITPASQPAHEARP